MKKLYLCLFALLSLSGCTSIGTHILSHPNVYLPEANLLDIAPQALGIETKQFCHTNQISCFDYLYATAYKTTDFSEDSKVYYNVQANGNGVENSVSFAATPASFNRIKGTAVLLHGFGGSKEAMLVTSIYFRALGMNILALDLFGHGDSKEDFVFGSKEHYAFSQLLKELQIDNKLTRPVIVVGHSMGALTATNLLKESPLVDGAILLAPMMPFDRAAKHYLAYKNSTLNELFAENLDEIVAKAMLNKNLKIADTSIPEKIKNTQKPVLIINSDVDSVSPPKYFSPLQSNFIQQVELKGRSHPSLITFDNSDTGLIEGWIQRHFASEFNNKGSKSMH